jgi:hypothetical protein
MNSQWINELQDYMFTLNNLNSFTKHIIHINVAPKASTQNIIPEMEETPPKNIPKPPSIEKKIFENKRKIAPDPNPIYKPKQQDSLFWCLYILKHGYFNYEMEINGRYFVVEKQEKFKYIETLRKNKDLIKIHKIKPFTELEDDLANKDRISVKTFFALCVLENINILLVNKRKIFELTCVDIDNEHPVHVIHRNSKTMEHHMELDISDTKLQHYRDTYYKCDTLGSTLKAISSYKLDELLDLCKKLDINLDIGKIEEKGKTKKKWTKKDVYELLVQNY